jgi:hypothetical protein
MRDGRYRRSAKAREYLAKALLELGVSAETACHFTMLCYELAGSHHGAPAIQDLLLKNWESPACSILSDPADDCKVYGSDYDFWKGGVALGAVVLAEEVAKSYYSTIGAPYNYCDPSTTPL